MGKTELLLAISFAILATSHAQDTRCGLTESLYANPSKPHETYCNFYYGCDAAQNGWLMQCPNMTLYDSVTRLCLPPQFARCFNMQCDMNTQSQAWPSHCCRSYIGCNLGSMSIVYCPFGQVFDTSQKKCVAGGTCTPHRLCFSEQVILPTTAPPRCLDRAVASDPCRFQRFGTDGTDYGIQSCAEGTSWNPTLCNCGTFNATCKRTVVRVNSVDAACPAALGLSFPRTSSRPMCYTMKTTNGQRQDLGYYIGTNGYSGGDTEATIGNVGTSPGFLHIYHYTENMPVAPFGIKITFMASAPVKNGYSFSLVTNDFSTQLAACSPTLDVKAAWSTGRWTISINAASVAGNTAQSAYTLAFIAASSTDYITVTIMQDADNNIGGFIRTQNGLPVTIPSKPLPAPVGINICGLRVAQGLVGTLREAAFYEACSSPAALTTALS